MKHSETFAQLAAALAKAQAMFTAPPKDKTAHVKTKDGGSYSYDYSDLATVIATVKPGMSANGLSIFSLINHESTRPMLETILMHESGEWISMLYPIALTGRPQDIGAEITYARRYSVSCMLGIASDQDDDANAAQGNNAQTGRKPVQVQPQRNTTTTSSSAVTTTQNPPQAQIGDASAGSSGESSSADKAAALRTAAIAFKKKWTDKLTAAFKTHPEAVAMLTKVAAENQATAEMATAEIITRAKRIMVNVCNTTGEIEDKAPGEE